MLASKAASAPLRFYDIGHTLEGLQLRVIATESTQSNRFAFEIAVIRRIETLTISNVTDSLKVPRYTRHSGLQVLQLLIKLSESSTR